MLRIPDRVPGLGDANSLTNDLVEIDKLLRLQQVRFGQGEACRYNWKFLNCTVIQNNADQSLAV